MELAGQALRGGGMRKILTFPEIIFTLSRNSTNVFFGNRIKESWVGTGAGCRIQGSLR
jgi:hypothetical protein